MLYDYFIKYFIFLIILSINIHYIYNILIISLVYEVL